VECNHPLRHYYHLVNHYFKWHSLQPYVLDKLKPREEQQKFYMWAPDEQRWKEVTRDQFIWAQQNHTKKCFAMTKQQSKRSAANEQPKKKQRNSVNSSSSQMSLLRDHLEP
jgi:hypothetical protein